jgi:uncharacterized protein with PIN domain
LTVLDAQALIAFLVEEPAASHVEALLRDATSPPRVGAANLGEVVDVLARTRGRTSDEISRHIDLLVAAGLEIIKVDEGIARVAGRIRAARYRRVDRPLSLADCLALATAAWLDDRLATSDPALARTAREEGREVIGLPDSAGRPLPGE